MKEKTTKNSGFTLIELIIAMAVLAFLMTAISSFMGTGIMSFKKAKSDIAVHNSAQDVYDQLSSSFMSANQVVILAYVVDGTVNVSESNAFTVNTTAILPSFPTLENELTSGVVLDGPYYFVKDDKVKDALNGFSYQGFKDSSSKGILKFEDIPSGTKLYVKQIIIDHAVNLDPSYSSVAITLGEETKNDLTGENVKINYQKREVINAEGNKVTEEVKDSAGNPVYDVNDTERIIFTFDKENMYVERKYAFMDALNDYSNSRGINTLKKYIYSESFDYMEFGDSKELSIPGCLLTIDDSRTAVSINLYFADKNMTYKTNGFINLRNSYILKNKK